MVIKIIKFDLPINSIKVTTLEALRDNLTDEIVNLARSGQLERWCKSRQLQELAQDVATAVSRNKKDKELFLALCALLQVEVHPNDVSAIFDSPPEAGSLLKSANYFNLYQELKNNFEITKAKLNIAEKEINEYKIQIQELKNNYEISKEKLALAEKEISISKYKSKIPVDYVMTRNHIGQLVKTYIKK